MLKSKNRAAYYDLGGTIRAKTPDETMSNLKPLLPKIGITRIADITGLDNIGINVITCIRPNAKHLSISQGKGLTKELATISAIMEAMETYHAENPPRSSFTGNYNELAKKIPVINPNDFNRGIFSTIDLRDTRLEWVQGFNLKTGDGVYIPHVLTCLDSTIIHPEYGYLSVSTNGLAAGNSFDEAVCHALYELVERDSLCRWRSVNSNQKNANQINISTITDDDNKYTLACFDNADIDVKIWDITSVLEIPSFHCVIYDRNVFRGLGRFAGTGTHLSKNIALSRALTEAAQSRLTLISGNRDDVFSDYYFSQATENSSIAMSDIKNGIKDFDSCSEPEYQQSFNENINLIVRKLAISNYNDIYYVLHTKNDLKIPVVQLFVPGLKFNGSRV